ncbi:MAG: polysaccharide biosynthesis/export family protein [Lentisphaerota bacterium]
MMKTRINRVWMLAPLLMGAALIAGCQTAGPKNVYTEGSEPDVSVKLEAGDLVDVKFYYAPELNELQRIRPDGNITLQLLGEVKAAGLTPGKFQEALKEKFTGLIDKPEVAVFVREQQNRAVFVGGAVKNPGRIAMPGSLTALSAIMQAGGFDMVQAGFNNVVVIRMTDDKPQAFVLDYSKELNGEPGEPFYLHAQDIVQVPRTRVVDANQWIDQYLNKMVPQFGLTATRSFGDGTVGIDTSRR